MVIDLLRESKCWLWKEGDKVGVYVAYIYRPINISDVVKCYERDGICDVTKLSLDRSKGAHMTKGHQRERERECQDRSARIP